MCFAGGVGADVTGLPGGLPDEAKLFGESPSRFLCEVKPEHAGAFERCFAGVPVVRVGATVAEPRLRVAGGQRRVADLR
jgi:phosphoribosylformylglycinamidine synthase